MIQTTGFPPTGSSQSPGATRLLVTGMTHVGGELHLAELTPVARQCGFTSEQLRSCLRRMVAEGLYQREGSGQGAVYCTTARGAGWLAERGQMIRRAYQQDAGAAPWDGVWHLAGFAVPEMRRDARDRLRETLADAGGASLQGGLYVAPHSWEEQLRRAVKDLEIDGCLNLATTRDLEVGGVSEPRLVARLLWRLDALGHRYQRFLDTYAGVPAAIEARIAQGELFDDAEIIPGVFAMAQVWTEGAAGDPLLPAELLPEPWPGRAARELLLRSRRLVLAARRDQRPLTLFSGFDESLES